MVKYGQVHATMEYIRLISMLKMALYLLNYLLQIRCLRIMALMLLNVTGYMKTKKGIFGSLIIPDCIALILKMVQLKTTDYLKILISRKFGPLLKMNIITYG